MTIIRRRCAPRRSTSLGSLRVPPGHSQGVRVLDTYPLHASLRADLDGEECVHHLRERIEVGLASEVVDALERQMTDGECEPEVLRTTLLRAHLDEQGAL